MNYRYTLEPYKGPATRHTCPACGRKRSFTRYIDTQTGQHLADHVGRCNRELNCTYHMKPREFFAEQGHTPAHYPAPQRKQSKSAIQPPSFMPLEVFKASLGNYGNNNLVEFLQCILGQPLAQQLVERYYIGTHNHWAGSTVFWQVDEQYRIRAGKVMLYDFGGRRIREPHSHVSWVHSIGQMEGYKLSQCLFGQHLLRGNTKTIAITESEKTALIAAAYFPQFTWMATGSCSNLNADMLRPLAGQSIILYPDLDAIDKWAAIAEGMDNCSVSRILKDYATDAEVAAGLDLADYLLWNIRHITG